MNRVVIELRDGYVTRIMCEKNADITVIDWDDIETGSQPDQYPEKARLKDEIDDFLLSVDEKIDLMWTCSSCEYKGIASDFADPGICLACAKAGNVKPEEADEATETHPEMSGYAEQ